MPRHAYLFSINPNTPPLTKLMPDEEFRIQTFLPKIIRSLKAEWWSESCRL